MTSYFDFLLKHDNLLQLTFDQFFELVDALIAFVASEDDVELGKGCFILVELALHEGVVRHEGFRSLHLLHQELMQSRRMTLPKHLVGISLNLIVRIVGRLCHGAWLCRH